MDTYMECYREYIEHFKKFISICTCTKFREWSINMRVTIDASHILYTSNSTNGCNNNAQGNCEEEKVESKKNCERESWSKE